MAYAQCYILAEETMDVFMDTGSDDTIQVILNEEEVFIYNIDRGFGLTACSPQDIGTPVTLVEGENRLIVKVFESAGGWNFALRFTDAVGFPITEGITISKTPMEGCRVPAALVTRSVDTGQTTAGGQPVWSVEGVAAGVILDISDVRQAAGDCGAVGSVTITETAPANWVPSNPSNGGNIVGNVITWNLTAPLPASLTYTVETAAPFGEVKFSGEIEDPGSPFSFRVRGDSTIAYVPPRLPRGAALELINDDFDTYGDTDCPDGFSCNGGSGGLVTFTPGVTQDPQNDPGHEGRLRLTCGDNVTLCGTGASSVIYDELVDLATYPSFTAEFDAFFTLATGTPADGLTFCVLDASDLLIGPTSVGAAGGLLGYDGLNGFAVELDIYSNGGTEESGYNDTVNTFGHVAVIRDGAVLPHVQVHLDLDPDMFPQRLGGNGFPEFVGVGANIAVPLHIEVDYNNGNLEVYLSAPESAGGQEPEFPRTKVIDTLVTFPGSGGEYPVLQEAYMGFTAGTGSLFADQEVDDVLVTLYETGPCEATEPGGETTCDDGQDNDCDGLTDCADPDCAASCVETDCGDSVDNDGDTLTDCDDPDCAAQCEGGGFVRGDADASGAVNITDAIFLLGYLFQGTTAPTCLDAADVDDLGAGAPNITDAIFLLGWLFQGTAFPPEPTPMNGGAVSASYAAVESCGPDETEPDGMDCGAFPPCTP
jgi:hypothetical protein